MHHKGSRCSIYHNKYEKATETLNYLIELAHLIVLQRMASLTAARRISQLVINNHGRLLTSLYTICYAITVIAQGLSVTEIAITNFINPGSRPSV